MARSTSTLFDSPDAQDEHPPLELASLDWEGWGVVGGIVWSSEVPVPKEYTQRSASIPDTAERAITLAQITKLEALVDEITAKVKLLDPFKDLERITGDTFNMYNMDAYVVRPLTKPFRCAFVDLVAAGPQPPQWFVSHWWGTPFRQTCALLRYHAKRRQLKDSVTYWICTFANNQHNLGELSGAIDSTPFVRAILLERCQGTVCLLDADCTPFKRVWCLLENHVSEVLIEERKADHFVDLAAWCPFGTYINQDVTPHKPNDPMPTLKMDMGHGKLQEDHEFPAFVAEKGVLVDVVNAEASRKADKDKILHMIAGTPEELWSSTSPPQQCEAYDAMNRRIRRPFVAAAVWKASLERRVDDMKRMLAENPEALNGEGPNRQTPLWIAACHNLVEPLKYLISAGADVNVGCHAPHGPHPIWQAAKRGHVQAVHMLAEAKADLTLKHQGQTPLQLVSAGPHKNDGVAAVLNGRDMYEPRRLQYANLKPKLAPTQQTKPLLEIAELPSVPATGAGLPEWGLKAVCTKLSCSFRFRLTQEQVPKELFAAVAADVGRGMGDFLVAWLGGGLSVILNGNAGPPGHPCFLFDGIILKFQAPGLADGAWHHAVVVYDAEARVAELFLEGRRVESHSYEVAHPVRLETVSVGGQRTSCEGPEKAAQRHWPDGQLKDVALYARRLAADEAGLIAAGQPLPEPASPPAAADGDPKKPGSSRAQSCIVQ